MAPSCCSAAAGTAIMPPAMLTPGGTSTAWPCQLAFRAVRGFRSTGNVLSQRVRGLLPQHPVA